MSRFARGETCATQRRRLRSFLKTDELHTRVRLYAQVHQLSSLDGCIAEHAVVPRNTRKTDQDERWVQVRSSIIVFVV